MHRRSTLSQTLTAIAAIGLSVVVATAAPPTLHSSLVQKTNLSDADRAAITEFVNHHCDILAGATPDGQGRADAIDKASRELRKHISGRGVLRPSEGFRHAYTVAAIDTLRTVLEGDDTHAAVNAAIVLGSLGHSRALDLLFEHATIDDEPRMQVRLRAAAGCGMILSQGTINERRGVADARRLKDAAKVETDPYVLRHLIGSIAVAAKAPWADGQANAAQVRRQVQSDIRKVWVDALNDTTGRVAAAPNVSPLVSALYVAIPEFRDVYLTLPQEEARTLGSTLGPSLGRILVIPVDAGDLNDCSPLVKEYLKAVINVSHEFLKIVDTKTREDAIAPRTRLGELIQAEPLNVSAYRTDVEVWAGILSQAPYRQ